MPSIPCRRATLRCARLTLLLLPVLLLPAGAARALSLTLDVPPPLAADADLLERFWAWLIAETGAPSDLPKPPIVTETLPSNATMAMVYPTRSRSAEPIRVAVAERAWARARAGDSLIVLGELAHELVHYVLLMREHGWEYGRFYFERARHDHCDAEFQRLLRHVGAILWQAYHSNVARRAVEQMVQRACWEEGQVRARR